MCRFWNNNSCFNRTLQSWSGALNRNTDFRGLRGYEIQSCEKGIATFCSIDYFSYLGIINHFKDSEYQTRYDKMLLYEFSFKSIRKCGC